ncbi:MFS transporter [Microtetraspora sp. NBRC 16547]|uniref:MFS transporter n=1 Tax=Microtetraspora sp. NBRC 16547 TaxID=3030993 RepID=UPI0024A4D5C3|nr:MFS transporter [Microtetraspora sp. NBRC 16547]GLX02570.1 hypothetical protein Misp02_66560 [Microtetraspora sp. NBRC 16547]
MSPEEPGLRLARAAVFATVCVLVSAAGHFFAGGGPVAPGVLAAGALGALTLAYVLNGRERGPEAVMAATVAAQDLLHELFTWSASAPAVHSAHGHLGVGMLLVHLLVALVSGWWLCRGEDAVWLMLRLWGAPPFPLPRRLRAVPEESHRPLRQAVPPSEAEPHRGHEIAPAIPRRGPPVPCHAG